MSLHMSYDGKGFEVALENSDGQECENHEAIIDQYVVDGFHDFKTGNCQSFQIYRDDGSLMFSFPETYVEMVEKYCRPEIVLTLEEALSGKLEEHLGIKPTGKEIA